MLNQTQVSNTERFMNLLRDAVESNTVRPRPEEEKKISVSKYIRCSPEIEGDSQLAMILFAGIANQLYNVKATDIIEYFGMEPDEYEYKIRKFRNNFFEAVVRSKKNPINWVNPTANLDSRNFDMIKLYNKVQLITNYINLHANKYDVLIGRA